MNLLEGYLEELVRASPIIDKASSDVRLAEGEDEKFRASRSAI